MTIQQDIDKLFKDKLDGYSEKPPGFIWDNVDQVLNVKRIRKQKRIFYSIAATVALMLSFGTGYMFTHIQSSDVFVFNETEIPKVDVAINQVSLNENKTKVLEEKKESEAIDKQKNLKKQSQNDQVEKTKEVKEPVQKKTKINSKQDSNVKKINSSGTLLPPMFASASTYQEKAKQIPEFNEAKEEEFLMESIELTHINSRSVSEIPELRYDERQLAYVDAFVLPADDENEISAWSIGMAAAPLMSYRDVGSSSSDLAKLAEINTNYTQNYNNEKPLMSYSAGVDVNYRVSKRWNIQSGLYFSELGQISENILVSEVPVNSYDPTMYAVNTSTGNITIQGSPNEIIDKVSPGIRNTEDLFNAPLIPGGIDVKNEIAQVQTNIVQTYEFYEVPVVVNYKLVDRKFGLSLSGGVSANIMYGNAAYIEESGSRYELEATVDNLKNMNYSGILGLGMEYPIIKKLCLNLKPTFRYSLSPINETGSVYPYSFGLFTGLKYTF